VTLSAHLAESSRGDAVAEILERPRLIVNADDLGLVESVNRGIVEAVERGIVTSASLMVNMAGTMDALARLRALLDGGRRISVGLHFNIVAGAPLAATASLGGQSLAGITWLAMTGRLSRSDVEAELRAQLDRALSLLSPLGLSVSHLDSHRHVHVLPGLLELVTNVAASYGITHVRQPRDSFRPVTRPRVLTTALLADVALRASPDVAPAEIAFAGIGFMSSRTYTADVSAFIARLRSGTTELMVHPGYDSPGLRALDPYAAQREAELRALTSSRVRSIVRQRRILLASFAD
jgi:chitin disaccharide deacetylase